uniref:Uncharacterized protein n=1 Tax=Anguilla anguilla TaxID=7936 RepID=A0A0E9UY40_ANGAN
MPFCSGKIHHLQRQQQEPAVFTDEQAGS